MIRILFSFLSRPLAKLHYHHLSYVSSIVKKIWLSEHENSVLPLFCYLNIEMLLLLGSLTYDLKLKLYKLESIAFATRFTLTSRVHANVRHTFLKSYLQYVQQITLSRSLPCLMPLSVIIASIHFFRSVLVSHSLSHFLSLSLSRACVRSL